MGNFYSSLSEDAKAFSELSTPTLNKGGLTPGGESQVTPKTPENNAVNPKIAGLIDPRSPSQGVSRTPLEIEERNKKIDRTRLKNHFNKENSLTVPLVSSANGDDAQDDLMTTPTNQQSKEFPPGFDPRSPNPEITRTPIALSQTVPVVGRKMFQNQENVTE